MMEERRLDEWIDGWAGGIQAISQQPESVLHSVPTSLLFRVQVQGSTNTAARVSVAQAQTELV